MSGGTIDIYLIYDIIQKCRFSPIRTRKGSFFMRNLKSSFWNQHGTMIKQSLAMGLGSVAFIALLIASVGCQGRITFEANGYYPDRTGDKRVGDPRRPMFEGSGFSEDEGRTASESGYSKHFEGRDTD